MKIKDKIFILGSVILAKLFKRRIPIAISWMITRRCNYACRYCSDGEASSAANELNTGQVLWIIEKFKKAGVKIISFTGGEPLLREDIGNILAFCAEQKIQSRMNSNGSLVPLRINEIRHLDFMNLSLDGPEEINDQLRGRGAFKKTIQAAQVAFESGIKLGFQTVLSVENLNPKCSNFVVETAKKFKAFVVFQPAFNNLLRGQGRNPVTPDVATYRKAIDHLIRLKREGANIGNSLTGLRYLYSWPDGRRIRCAGEFIFRRIDAEGNLMYCGVEEKPLNMGNCLRKDIGELFSKTSPTYCNACWCAQRMELNHAFFGDWDAVKNHIMKSV